MKLSKLIPILFLVFVAFQVASYYIGDKADEQRKKDFETERQQLKQLIESKEEQIKSLEDHSSVLREKLKSDSTRYAENINIREQTIAGLKKRINEINLSNYTISDLDSLRAVLYGSK